jgi:hypothetical protein
MGLKKQPDLTDLQEKLVHKYWLTGRGAGEISRLMGTSQAPVDRAIFKLGLIRTKQEMFQMRKDNGLNFAGVKNGQKVTANYGQLQSNDLGSLWDRAWQRANQAGTI